MANNGSGFRVLVCGGRNYSNYKRVAEFLASIEPTVVIHGGARGADSLAGRWARENNVKEEVYPAKWNLYGRAAGPIRNRQMLEESKPDLVVAFPGGSGTAHMIGIAVDNITPVLEVDDDGPATY